MVLRLLNHIHSDPLILKLTKMTPLGLLMTPNLYLPFSYLDFINPVKVGSSTQSSYRQTALDLFLWYLGFDVINPF